MVRNGREKEATSECVKIPLNMLRTLLLVTLPLAVALGQDPISPHSAIEPPAAKAAASLAASF
jgi:hypothetical protein